MNKTIFCDIDGTLLHHSGDITKQTSTYSQPVRGALETFKEWERRGYTIVLMTGRKESARHQTECNLRELGFSWDHLIMGIGGGDRILINDDKPHKGQYETCFSYTVTRNGNISYGKHHIYDLKDI